MYICCTCTQTICKVEITRWKSLIKNFVNLGDKHYSMKMTNEMEARGGQYAVKLDNSIIMFGGLWKTSFSTRVIWTYNLYTEEWRKYAIPHTKEAPEPFVSAITVTIDGAIYSFGGATPNNRIERNALWKLSRTRECFTWSFIKPQCKEESPSPRDYHSGWEYEGKL